VLICTGSRYVWNLNSGSALSPSNTQSALRFRGCLGVLMTNVVQSGDLKSKEGK
jgi:hypothetical protein